MSSRALPRSPGSQSSWDRNYPLWSRDRIALDRRNEIHKLRGCRHRTSGDAQPADELALCSHGATKYIRSLGSGRDRLGHRNRTTVRISARLRYSQSVGMFLTTLSFLFTTPGWEPTLGFPGISAMPGQFLLKDVVLLGAAIFTASEAFGAVHRSETAVEHAESVTAGAR